MSSAVQELRLRRSDPPKSTLPTKKPSRHTGILQDQVRRAARPPWTPSFSFALRLLLLVRVSGAMYSNIDDCDEVFNFWEPLHYFQKGYGFQTWEVAPQFAIRSWAYILFHLPVAQIGLFLGSGSKRPGFFAVRIFLAFLSSFSEASLYSSVRIRVNDRLARYLFFILLFNAGMWNASAALLPSSFAMYTSSWAFAASMGPASLQNGYHAFSATLLFALGSILGWPFALALAIPFVAEQLFVFGKDRVESTAYYQWIGARWQRLFTAGLLAALIFVPVIGIDSVAYGKLAVVPWNIIAYNIFSDRGPELYGTSPWTFYFMNLLLNFNVVLPLALVSLPALYITSIYDRKRLGFINASKEESSPFTILGLRLAPFYLWLYILTSQPHKEERFMFPAYTMLCFNAAVSLYLIRGWMETAYIQLTKSPYKASKTTLFSTFTFSVIVFTSLLSLSRILANWNYYHAPLSVFFHLETQELPLLLNSTGLLSEPLPPPDASVDPYSTRKTAIDLSPLTKFNLTLCLGKEWYRFPSHFLVPDGVKVEFIKSEFRGLLPAHFKPSHEKISLFQPHLTWPRPETRHIPNGMNDMNREVTSHYAPISQCSYLVDLDFPNHPSQSEFEPRYVADNGTWDRVVCLPFLDATHSPLMTRVLWMPGEKWRELNEWGDYCLLRNKKLVDDQISLLKLD